MKTRFLYFQMECKRGWKLLPFVLTGAIVLAALLGTIAFLAVRGLSGQAKAERIQAGIVLPPGDILARQGFSMLKSMESAESICDFYVTEEEEGRKQLKQGKLDCLVIIPEKMVEGIINGENTPVQLVFPGQESLETYTFSELVSSWVTILGSAQAGIYAADELLIRLNRADLIPEMENRLNEKYLSLAFSREKMYQNQKVSLSGNVSLPVYYGISGFIFYLFLCGIMASSLLMPVKQVLEDKLRLAGVGRLWITGSRTVVLFLLLSVCAAVFLMGMTAVLKLSFGGKELLAVGLVVLTISFLEVMVFEGAGNQMAGIMMVFLGAFLLLFLSGGFIPSMLLPKALRETGPYLPAGIMMSACKMAVTKTYEAKVWAELFMLLIVSALLASFAGVRKRR